jgi:DNA polymerase III subunit gamma/tau
VHMLSKAAFNALLKTLEEPPPHVKFIFATTEVRKVPVTVLSRCQRFDLRRVETSVLSAHLKRIAEREGTTIVADAALMIARAAEGSVRDGLSILDQAIATASGNVSADVVRQMLGLSEGGRVFGVLEAALGGRTNEALVQFGALHADGADPSQVIADLAGIVHLASRIKVAGKESANDAFSADEIASAAALAGRMSLGLLTRAWQMLLKGLEETAKAPDSRAAVDMLLIRIGHMAGLPSPEDLLARMGGAAAAPGAPPPTPPRGPAGAQHRPPGRGPEAKALAPAPIEAPNSAPTPAAPCFATFAELVDYVGSKREARLRLDLEDHVRLVKFEPPRLEINLTEGATSGLVGELTSKLKAWTGQRWVVVVSREAGEPPISEVRQEHDAKERELVSQHPIVRRVLGAFPGAEIKSVRPLENDGGSGDMGAAPEAE